MGRAVVGIIPRPPSPFYTAAEEPRQTRLQVVFRQERRGEGEGSKAVTKAFP